MTAVKLTPDKLILRQHIVSKIRELVGLTRIRYQNNDPGKTSKQQIPHAKRKIFSY